MTATKTGSTLVHGTEAERWGGWDWREPRYADHLRTCSYCGCVHPEDLLRADTWRAEWADQKYGWPHKFYVTIPVAPENAELLVCRSSSSGPIDSASRARDPKGYYVPVGELTDEQVDVLVKDRNYRSRDEWEAEKAQVDRYHGYHFTRAAEHPLHHKFYTTHLADPTLGEEVTDAIARRCGLTFTFADGKVSWRCYDYRSAS